MDNHRNDVRQKYAVVLDEPRLTSIMLKISDMHDYREVVAYAKTIGLSTHYKSMNASGRMAIDFFHAMIHDLMLDEKYYPSDKLKEKSIGGLSE